MRYNYNGLLRTRGWLCIGIIFILGVLFIISAVQDFLTFCRSDHILSYQGPYEVSEISSLRNTRYRFDLGNGDVIEVRESINPINFDVETILKFRYTKHTRMGLHTGVSISTVDDSVVILSEESAKNQFLIGAIGGSCLGAVCVIVSLFPVILWFLSRDWKPKKKSALKKKR